MEGVALYKIKAMADHTNKPLPCPCSSHHHETTEEIILWLLLFDGFEPIDGVSGVWGADPDSKKVSSQFKALHNTLLPLNLVFTLLFIDSKYWKSTFSVILSYSVTIALLFQHLILLKNSLINLQSYASIS